MGSYLPRSIKIWDDVEVVVIESDIPGCAFGKPSVQSVFQTGAGFQCDFAELEAVAGVGGENMLFVVKVIDIGIVDVPLILRIIP